MTEGRKDGQSTFMAGHQNDFNNEYVYLNEYIITKSENIEQIHAEIDKARSNLLLRLPKIRESCSSICDALCDMTGLAPGVVLWGRGRETLEGVRTNIWRS